jgi:hypothetical protein
VLEDQPTGASATLARARRLCPGTLPFGTTVDDMKSLAILDRFAHAGGTLIDTANNYAFWVEGRPAPLPRACAPNWAAGRRGSTAAGTPSP